MSSLCEVVLSSSEFFVRGGPVSGEFVPCVRWSCILASSLCEVVQHSGEFFGWGGPVFW